MRKTPQEKKDDSYKHDRRNSYGESDKGSRKSIPRNKAITRRNARRVAKQKTRLDFDEDDVGIATPGKRPFEKSPDMPLGEFLDFQKVKRAKLANRHKKNP